jgi:hypothetical protein
VKLGFRPPQPSSARSRRCALGYLTPIWLLNPGGLLLVGNYLKPTPTSGHQEHVRAMMELYSHWYLRYRSADQIAGFASTIEGPHTVNLLDESGRPLQHSARAVIGFAAIQAA